MSAIFSFILFCWANNTISPETELHATNPTPCALTIVFGKGRMDALLNLAWDPHTSVPLDIPYVDTKHIVAPEDIGDHDLSFTKQSAWQLHNNICTYNQYLIAWIVDQYLREGVEPGLGLPRAFLSPGVVSGHGLCRDFLYPDFHVPNAGVRERWQWGAFPCISNTHISESTPSTPCMSRKRGRDSPTPYDDTDVSNANHFSLDRTGKPPSLMTIIHLQSHPSSPTLFPCTLSCGRLFSTIKDNKAHTCTKGGCLATGRKFDAIHFPCRIKDCTARFLTIKERRAHEDKTHAMMDARSSSSAIAFA